MKKILLIFFCLLSIKAAAQSPEHVTLSAMNESIAFPFSRFTPYHPGFEAGYGLHGIEKNNIIRSINLHLGWFFHKKVENAFYLRAEVAWRLKIKDFLSTDFYTGLGYMHTFYPGAVFELNQKSGDFERIRQTGRPHALANIGFGFSYRNASQFEPFIRQDIALETPFANGIPFMIHSFFKTGTRIKIKQK